MLLWLIILKSRRLGMRWIVRRLLSLRGDEARFARSLADFEDPGLRRRLQAIGDAFLAGYRAALEEEDPEALAGRVQRIDPDLWGFAHEGVGLGLVLLDSLMPRRRRFDAFLAGSGTEQPYMLHVGAGWVLARLPVSPSRFLARFDPLLRWMTLDGFGFHEAFFHWRRTVERRWLPPRLSGYRRRPFGGGGGRPLLLAPRGQGGRPARVVARFPESPPGGPVGGVGQ